MLEFSCQCIDYIVFTIVYFFSCCDNHLNETYKNYKKQKENFKDQEEKLQEYWKAQKKQYYDKLYGISKGEGPPEPVDLDIAD